jgi:hypothetical protein
MITQALLAISIVLSQTQPPANPQETNLHTPVVLKSGHYTGTLKGFSVGDYVHADFKNGQAKRSFWIGADFIQYFLVIHIGETISIKYDTVRAYVPEARQDLVYDTIVDAKAGSTSYSTWLKNQLKSSSREQLYQLYEPIFEKACQ